MAQANEQELKAAMKLALDRGDEKTARAIANQIVTGELPTETEFAAASRRRSEIEGSIADRERMRPEPRDAITEFGTPEDFAAGAARTAEFFAKLPGYVLQRKPLDESAGPLEREFRQPAGPVESRVAEAISPQNVERGFDALGINREGGEDTFMGRSGEFVTGGAIGGINNIIRAAKAAGFRGFAGSTARNVGSSETAAIGSEMGGNWAERAGLPPILGELTGALAPSFLLRTINRTVTGASQAERAENSLVAKDRIKNAKELDLAISAGTASPNSRVALMESTLAAIPGGTRVLHDFAMKTHRQIEQALKLITAPTRGDAGVEAAGIGIATAINRRIINFKKAGERLYRNAEELIPANQPIPITRFRGALDDLTGNNPERVTELINGIRAGRKQIAPKVAEALDKLEDGATLTFEEANAIRRVIGQEISGASLLGDAPIGELKLLYRSISDDIGAGLTVDVQRAAWKGANDFWKKGRQEIDDFYAPILNKGGKGEEVFNAVFASGGAKISTIRQVWKTMNAKEKELVSKAFIARLGKVSQDAGEEYIERPTFKMGTFLTNWNKPDFQATKRLMLSGQPKLRRDLDTFVDHITQVLNTGDFLANPSGTGAKGLAAATAYYALAGIAGAGTGSLLNDPNAGDAATAAVGGVAGLLVASKASRSAAILMTDPKFVSWLARGTRVPVNKTAEYFGQLAAIAQKSDPYVAEAIADFTNEYSSMLDPALLGKEDFQGREIKEE